MPKNGDQGNSAEGFNGELTSGGYPFKRMAVDLIGLIEIASEGGHRYISKLVVDLKGFISCPVEENRQ